MNMAPWCGDYTMYEGNRWYLTKNQFRIWICLDTSIVKDSRIKKDGLNNDNA